MKHFGIFILFVVTLIQYGYSEGEEAAQVTENETGPTNTEGENSENNVGESQAGGAEASQTQDSTVVTEDTTEPSNIENQDLTEAPEKPTETPVAESETEQSATENGNLNDALEVKEEGTSGLEGVTTTNPENVQSPEATVSTNAPPSGGQKDNVPSRGSTKLLYSPGLCQRPLTPRWPPVTRPCPYPFSRFPGADFQSPYGQGPFSWGNQNANIPYSWATCTNRPLPEPPGSILLKLRSLRNNNVNPPLCPHRDGGANRIPIPYSGYRAPPTYLGQAYTHL